MPRSQKFHYREMTRTESTLYLLPSDFLGIWVNFLHRKVQFVNFLQDGTLRAQRCYDNKTVCFPDSLQRPEPAHSGMTPHRHV
jgi:hypothetical protein